MSRFQKVKLLIIRFFRRTVVAAYIVLASYVTMLSGCKSMMVTHTVEPYTAWGYKVPNYKGWTFVFLNESRYNFEAQKLNSWKKMMDITHALSFQIYDMGIEWFNIAMTGGAMSIPFALKRLPRGAVTKDEHEAKVLKAGLSDPSEFQGS